MKLWVVDVGGSHVDCGLVAGGRVLARASVGDGGTGSFVALLPALAAALRAMGPADGLAVSFPALVDHNANRVLSTPAGKYEDAAGFDLAGWARDALGTRVRIETDARMTLLGERHAGALRGAGDAALLAIGTGIGSAAIVDGRLLRGRTGTAGTLAGHFSTDVAGAACICGGAGCMEALASTWALPRLAAADPHFPASALAHGRLDFAAIFALAAADPVARRLRDHCVGVWSAGVVSLIHAYDPEVVLLAGGVMASADVIVPAITAHVAAHSWTAGAKPEIRVAALGRDAALLGAEPLWAMG